MKSNRPLLSILCATLYFVGSLTSLHATVQTDDDRAVVEVAEILEEISQSLDPKLVNVRHATIEGRRALIVGEKHTEQFAAAREKVLARCAASQSCLFFIEGIYHTDTTENDVRQPYAEVETAPLNPTLIPIFGLEENSSISVLNQLTHLAFTMKLFDDELRGKHGKEHLENLVLGFFYGTYRVPVFKDFFSDFASNKGKLPHLMSRVMLFLDSIPSFGTQSASSVGNISQNTREAISAKQAEWDQILLGTKLDQWVDLFETMARQAINAGTLPLAHKKKLRQLLDQPANMALIEFFSETYEIGKRNQAFAHNVRDVIQQQPTHLPAIIWVGNHHVEGLHALLDDLTSGHEEL